MKTPTFGNTKPLSNPGQKSPATAPAKKLIPPPLSFDTKPGLNFFFGHQLVATPSRQAAIKPYNSARNDPGRTAKIDLSKFLTPAASPPAKTADAPKKMPNRKTDQGDDSCAESEEYIEVNMATDSENSENELNDNDLELVKRHLNEKAETQKTTFSLKTTERTEKGISESPTPNVKQKHLEEFVERLREDLTHYRGIVEQNNITIKSMNEEFSLAKQRYVAELELLKKELQGTKDELSQKEVLLSKAKDLAPRTLQQLTENRGLLKMLLDLIKENSKIAEDPKLIDQERLMKYQITANYASQIIPKINLTKLDDLIKTFKDIAAPGKPLEGQKPVAHKYAHQLNKIRTENALLTQQATELEKLVGTIQQTKTSQGSDLCWGLQENLTLRREKEDLKAKLDNIQAKYRQLLDKPVKPSNVNKLAQILAYLPKRRKQLKITEQIELRETFDKARRNWDNEREGYKGKIMELEKKIAELLSKLANTGKDNEGSVQENANLRRKIAELLGIIKVKDEQLNSLQGDLELAKKQLEELLKKIDKLLQDAHTKDILFADKVREMRGIFEDMRKEKENKQKEVLLLLQKIAELEKMLAESKASLLNMQTENEALKKDNERLAEEIEKIKTPEALDGFKAMVTLANMILARSKRPPPLSQTDKQLIKDLFEGNIQELLEEVGRLQQEGKVLREEVRRGIVGKNTPKMVLKLLLVYLANNNDNARKEEWYRRRKGQKYETG